MPGPKRLSGWGVRVRLSERRRGRRKRPDGTWDDGWVLLKNASTDKPLCTTLAGAQAWLADYQRRGCEAELIELKQLRGQSGRRSTKKSELEAKTPALF